MKSKQAERTTLGAELRKKFKTPQEALRQLGIDESVLKDPRLAFDGAKKMAKPNRLQYLVIDRIASALNPLLAKDAKVEYLPLVAGLTFKTFTKARRAKIVGDAKLLLKGKTVAKDASIEHLASMLDHFEHVQEPKSLDESVSGPQHRAMEAAAHGHSNLGISPNVGKEFSDADKGKTFRDALPGFMKEHGASDEEIASAMDHFGKSATDEEPDDALDEEETDIEVEQGEDEVELEEGEDAKVEEEEAEDEVEEEEAEDKSAKDKHAKDKRAKDQAMKTKTKPMTQDQVDKAIQSAVSSAVQAERKNSAKLQEARAYVRPWVGDLPMALDSAEKVYRAAAVALEIPEADTVHHSALKTLIGYQPKAGEYREMAQDGRRDDLGVDGDAVKSFNERFPGAARIGSA